MKNLFLLGSLVLLSVDTYAADASRSLDKQGSSPRVVYSHRIGVIRMGECNPNFGIGFLMLENIAGKESNIQYLRVDSEKICGGGERGGTKLSDIELQDVVYGKIWSYDVLMKNGYAVSLHRLAPVDPAYYRDGVENINHIGAHPTLTWFYERL